MLEIKPVILTGSCVQLEPLHESHKDELYFAAQDEKIWIYSSAKAYDHQFHSWFDKAMKALHNNEHIPFAVRRLRDNKLVGSTRYYDITHKHYRLTIGYTWYVPEVWGTAVNPESKFLLFKHAFETAKVNRIEFVVDARNLHSRAAIKKLGAVEEGILRQHMITDDNYLRDSVMFSVVQSDWPEIRQKLQGRIS